MATIKIEEATESQGIQQESIPEITLQFHKTTVFGQVKRTEESAALIRSLFSEGSIELQEQFFILYLNKKLDVIGFYHHAKGGIDASIVDVRLILSAALKSLSSSIIIAHNHPSGQLKPSNPDIQITEKIKSAAKLMDIQLLDHVIITKEGYYSFADEGLLGLPSIQKSSHQIEQPSEKQKEMKTVKKLVKTERVKEVERVDEEIRFIKRYAIMHKKVKTKVQILGFLNAVQKAILEKRIRKTSVYAKEIIYIQTNLTKLHNLMKDKAEIKVDEKVLNRFLKIAGSTKERLSITYLKRYVGIQGKKLTKEKAERLIDGLKAAVKNGKLVKGDPYADRLDKAFTSLALFVQKAKKNDTLEIHPTILNGLNEALDGCNCEKKKAGLNGVDESLPAKSEAPPSNNIMSSMDFAKLKFDTLGFKGKWRDLIGDPSEGFTAMVFGKPKMGKSYLCVDFAGYLAREHGNTLYVAKEEKLDKTLQDKLNDKNVKHPRLFVSDHIPNDLSPYQFIFLDSVNKLGLKPEDLERLKAENPGKSFIYVFQTTKEGNFRGANQFQHDVDVVIEVPEKGKAVQFGRFNQGGEMDIFDNIK
jgi:DNA repair protein RadC